MTIPEIHAEIALTTDPLTRPGALDWTRVDTTCPLRSLSTRRGAGLRDGSIVTGSAQALFDNRTADLLPQNPTGAWYPDLTLRRRIRFMADGTTPIFTGYIDRLPIMWDKSRSDGVVEVGAVDLLSLLAEAELPPSVLHQTIVDLNPVAYWPLAETQGTFADDVVGSWDGKYRRPVTNGEAILPYDDRQKVRCSAPTEEDPSGQAVTVNGFTGSTTQTVSLWVDLGESAVPLGFASLWIQSSASIPVGGPAAVMPRFWIGASLSSVGVFVDDGTDSEIVQIARNTFGLRNITVTVDTAVTADPTLGVSPITMYLNGVKLEWPDTFSGLTRIDPFTDVDLDTVMNGVLHAFLGYSITTTNATGYAAPVSDLAVWDRVLTPTEIASIYAAGTEAWDGDTTGTRVERILDAIGIDADDRDISTGMQTCGPTKLDGNALEYLRRIATTERGALFVSADGKLTFTDQYDNDPTPLDVIGDAGCPYSNITVDYSLDRMVNVAEVTPENGVTHSFTDATTRSQFGPRTLTRNTMHASPSGAKSMAAELVARNKDLRVQVLDVTLESHSTAPSTVTLDTEIGDPYSVSYQPTGVPDAPAVLVRVESIVQRFEPGSWRTTLTFDQQVVLPTFTWDTSDQGWDQSVWA